MKKLFLAVFGLMILYNCSRDSTDVVDNERPKVDMSIEGAFPYSCAVIERGKSFTYKMHFTDDVELGSYGMDIHNNFDHHNHDEPIKDCGLDPVKEAVNPFTLIKTYDIDPGKKSFVSNIKIDVPADVDPGDYHFMIKVTDKSGWQTTKGLSVKIK